MRDFFFQRAGFCLFFFVFLADCFGDLRRIDAGAFGNKSSKGGA